MKARGAEGVPQRAIIDKNSSNRARFTMIWLLSYISIASVSAAMITPALPAIERAFTLNTGKIEWVVSTFLIGYVIGQLIYAPLANVYGRLNALKWGLNVNIIGLALCLYASVPPHFGGLALPQAIAIQSSTADCTEVFKSIGIRVWLLEHT